MKYLQLYTSTTVVLPQSFYMNKISTLMTCNVEQMETDLIRTFVFKRGKYQPGKG